MLDPDQLLSLVPPRWLGVVVTLLAFIKILDEIVRLIPDRWLSAHTTVQLFTNALGKLAAWAGKKAPPAALLLFVPLLFACKASPQVIATTSTIAAVQTVDAGIDYFESHVLDWEVKIAQDAVEGCRTSPTREAYKACTDGVAGPRRQPIDRVKVALKLYRMAVVAGQSVDQTLSNLTGALAGVGVTVGGGK